MGLATIMSAGRESLHNAKAAIEVTGHNITNAHTKGYSRQRVLTTSKDPLRSGRLLLGTGAKIGEINRSHDKYIEMALLNEVQGQSLQNQLKVGLRRLEDVFNPAIAGSVIDQLNAFESSVNELTLFPEELTIRTNVSGYGESMANAFKQARATVDNIRGDYNNMIGNEIDVVNGLLSEISDLSGKIQESENEASTVANDFRDTRDEKILELASRLDISWYEDDNNLVIRGPGSTLLVEGRHHGTLKAAQKEDGNEVYFQSYGQSEQRIISHQIKRGSLRGYLDIRDKFAKNINEKLDEMAYRFTTRFNQVHRQGVGIGDFSSSQGRDFFRHLDKMEGAASQISLADEILADGNSISTGFSVESPGDNINANQLFMVFSEKLFQNGSVDFHSFYSDQAGKIGIEAERAELLAENSTAILTQLQKRKDEVSGVSMDEEAANLMKFQHLFAASSKLITTTDELFETILDLKR